VSRSTVYSVTPIAYGRLDRLGRPANATYADIYPTGDFLGMVLGHFFSMEAATIPEKGTLGYKIASRFRQRRLKSVIVRIRAVHHSLERSLYNCNDFVAEVARGMGMQTQTTLSLPYDFIPRL
jgi:hypothetical protein